MIFTLLLFLCSCTKFSLFTPPMEDSQEIEVKSLPAGGILNPDESVTFILHALNADQDALNLEIVLTTPAGESLWSTNIASPLINEELELILPDLEDGQYILCFELIRESGATIEKKIDFFHAAGEFSILGIKSYPPTIFPGAQSLLAADLLMPAGSDPYIRWTQDNTVLARGLMSEGLAEINWSAPQQEGVYSIQVEVFPASPLSNGDYGFTSAISMSASLYVSAKQILSNNDLGPEESYYSLFHFNGALSDSGLQGSRSGEEYTSGQAEVELIGNPLFVSEGDHFGYRLERSSGIKYPRFILPVKEGLLRPFTLTLSLLLEDLNAGRDILSSGFADNLFTFRLYLDREGLPAASIIGSVIGSGGEVHLPSGIRQIESGEEFFISLSIVPSEDSITAFWFKDGLPTAFTAQEIELEELPETEGGDTLIGGENGFSGVITELGVYFQDAQHREAIDPSIYAAAMERKYGQRLILAEGFDGLYLPDGFVLENEGRLKAGALQVGPASSLTLPAFEAAGGLTTAELAFYGLLPPGSSASFFWEDSSSAFLVITQEGEIQAPGNTGSVPAITASNPTIRVAISETGLTVITPEGEFDSDLLKPGPAASWVTVRLDHPGLKSSSAGESILGSSSQEAPALALDRITVFTGLD